MVAIAVRKNVANVMMWSCVYDVFTKTAPDLAVFTILVRKKESQVKGGLLHEAYCKNCAVCVYAVFTHRVRLCLRTVNAVFTESSRKSKFACLCLPAWLLSVQVFVFTLCLRVFGVVFVFACLR